MDPIIQTPRLILTQLTDTEIGSQHLQWFHENWSDMEATAWSLHGPCKTLEESQTWMLEHMTKYKNIFYAVHLKPSPSSCSTPPNSDRPEFERGELVGSVSLRITPEHPDPELPPPPPTSTLSPSNPLNRRVLGYAFFLPAWGKGYATEADEALIASYKAFRTRQAPDELWYIEAHVDHDNPDSAKVLKKVGFEELGWKQDPGQAFLAGEWRDQVFSVWGMWL